MQGTNHSGSSNGNGTRLVWWLLGINASIVTLGISVVGGILWSLNSSVVTLAAGQAAIVQRVTQLEAAVTARASVQYTSGEALRDRDAINQTIERVSRVGESNRDRIVLLEKDFAVIPHEIPPKWMLDRLANIEARLDRLYGLPEKTDVQHGPKAGKDSQ